MISKGSMIAGAVRPPGFAHAPCAGGCGSILNEYVPARLCGHGGGK